MLVPDSLSSTNYSQVFRVTVESSQDNSSTTGKYTGSGKKLIGDKSKEASNLGFSWSVIEHSSLSVQIEMQFDEPNQVSSSMDGFDRVKLDLLDPLLFLSAKDQTELDLSNLVNKQPVIVKEMPRMLANKELQQQIETSVETTGTILNVSISGNLFIMLVLGGSLQMLWGTIRAL